MKYGISLVPAKYPHLSQVHRIYTQIQSTASRVQDILFSLDVGCYLPCMCQQWLLMYQLAIAGDTLRLTVILAPFDSLFVTAGKQKT